MSSCSHHPTPRSGDAAIDAIIAAEPEKAAIVRELVELPTELLQWLADAIAPWMRDASGRPLDEVSPDAIQALVAAAVQANPAPPPYRA